MTDLPYVLAAYAAVAGALVGYAIRLRQRLVKARRLRANLIDAAEASRVRDPQSPHERAVSQR